MFSWKVWLDYDLLFEGDEEKARQYLREHVSDKPELTLESPDGDSYCYEDGIWVFQGAAGSWGPNGAYRPQQ